MQNEKSQISDLESAIRSAGKSALNTQSSVLPPQSSLLYPLAEALERLLSALRAASAGGRLRLSGLMGFGTELILLAACSWWNMLDAYLLLNVFVLNGVWLSSVLYRRQVLAGNLSRESSS